MINIFISYLRSEASQVNNKLFMSYVRSIKMVKRSASTRQNLITSALKTRCSGIDPTWHTDFPWILPTEDGEGLFCSLCRKHKEIHGGKAVWTDVLCTSLTRQALVKHGKSASHTEAMQFEATASSSRMDGGIVMAFQRVVSAERKAMIGVLKCMYFLTKQEIPHTTNFVPLCNLCKLLGLEYLQDLQHGANAQYTSERIKQELVQAFALNIAEPILENMCASPFFFLVHR